MIQTTGKLMYNMTPNFILRFGTKTNDKKQHMLYCEKLVISLLLMFTYIGIIVGFVHYHWSDCTNIYHKINNKYDENENKSDLFDRNDKFCNAIDWISLVYVFFLVLTVGLNVVTGLFYHYYRRYQNSKMIVDITHEVNNEKIIIHIPLYNEDEEVIKKTLDSVRSLNYNMDNLLLMIIVDGIIENPQTGKNIDEVLLDSVLKNPEYIQEMTTGKLYDGTIKYKDNKLKLYNGTYQNINYVVTLKCGGENESNEFKPGNRGKKDSAMILYETIDFIYSEYSLDNTHCVTYTKIIDYIEDSLSSKEHSINEYKYMLILDCDTEVEKNGLLVLVQYLKKNTDCITVCGETVVSNKYENFVTLVQCFEYFISHLLLKTFEHVFYNVFVSSGCFTLMKLTDNSKPVVNKNILRKYVHIEGEHSLLEKNLLELGEDRYLTSLIMKEFPDKYVSYVSDAKCFTCVPNSFKVLIDQRRRWTNSLISCLIMMAISPPVQSLVRHIKMYFIIAVELFIVFLLPLILLIGIVLSILSLTLQGFSSAPLIITLLVLCLNLIVATLALKMDMVLKFIPFFAYLPVFSGLIPLYSIWNLDDLRWGLSRDSEEVNNDSSNNSSV